MPFVQRLSVIIFVLLFSIPKAGAQELEYLTPVVASPVNKDTTALLLATVDLSLFRSKFSKQLYSNSLQIIDADQSWPPAWYVATPLYTKEMFTKDTANKVVHIDFTIKPEIGPGYISVGEIMGEVSTDGNFQNRVDSLEKFIILNKQMKRVDSIRNRIFNDAGWTPDFRKKNGVELLSYTRTMITKDMRSYTGNSGDDSVSQMAVILNVVDNNNRIKFTWNPLDHIDPKLFRFNESLQNLKQYGADNNQSFWFKFTSINWDEDGGILFSLKDMCIGKISRTDGSVTWQLNCSDGQVNANMDSLRCYSPTDFKFLNSNDTAAFYSFYEKGSDQYPHAGGVIFQRDKRTGKLKVLKFYPDKKSYGYCGQGAFDYNPKNGNYLIGYGACEGMDTASDYFQDAFEYGRKDSLFAVYQVPISNIVNGVHRLDGWPKPPRPTIVDKGTVLEVKGDLSGWTWYKLEGPGYRTVIKVGTGKSIKPEKDGVYCVVAKYGVGYSVSRIYRYEHNSPY